MEGRWACDQQIRLQVQLLAAVLSGAALGCITHVPLSRSSINLVPAQAGRVTVGLALHWPCITDTVVYPPTGSMAYDMEMSLCSVGVWHTLPLLLAQLHQATFVLIRYCLQRCQTVIRVCANIASRKIFENV